MQLELQPAVYFHCIIWWHLQLHYIHQPTDKLLSLWKGYFCLLQSNSANLLKYALDHFD